MDGSQADKEGKVEKAEAGGNFIFKSSNFM